MVPLSWGAQLSLMLASFELRLEYFGLFDTEGALDEGPRLSLLKMKRRKIVRGLIDPNAA